MSAQAISYSDNPFKPVVKTKTEYAIFRFRKDLRFSNGINPRTFEYVGGFYDTEEEAKELLNSKDNNYAYGIERITKYV